MIAMLVVISAVVGLVVGSFLNVVAYRIPAGMSVVHPRSRCPNCETPIESRDNVPVLSWLWLRGKCRYCGTRISSRYPIVEFSTALLFVATTLVVGYESWTLPAYLWFAAVTMVLILTDLDHRRIPNRILYPGTAAGVVLLGVGAWIDGDPGSFVRGLLGGLAYFAGLYLLAVIVRGGFGFGDVKLAFLLGVFAAFRSWGHVSVAVFLAFLIGGVVAIVLLATKRKGRKDAIPFGPALVMGAWLAIAAGRPILDWYLG